MKSEGVIKLVIVSPCYNEGVIIENTSDCLNRVLDNLISKGKISLDSFVLFVNDGSTDDTWEKIQKIHLNNSRICGLKLANNVGHQVAIWAGIMSIRDLTDAVVTIDSDLQDDINAIEEMVDRYLDGYDVVYGVKTNRAIDPWHKRFFASLFYKTQNFLGVTSVQNHADFRLLSSSAINDLSIYSERNIYLRGLIPLMGYKSTSVFENVLPRTGGKSKYTTKKQTQLAVDGITSFSTKPLVHIFIIGVAMMVIAVLMFIYVVVSLIMGHVIEGWTSLMLSIWFIGAVLTMGVGLIGIYIGKIYIEVKHRPLYRISDHIGISIE